MTTHTENYVAAISRLKYYYPLMIRTELLYGKTDTVYNYQFVAEFGSQSDVCDK